MSRTVFRNKQSEALRASQAVRRALGRAADTAGREAAEARSEPREASGQGLSRT